MKKSKAIFLPLLALSLMLAGCSEGEAEDSGSSTSSQITSSTSSQDLENNEIRRIYNLYLESGGTMTYEQWLATIKGEKGDTGATGPQGPAGKDGVNGKDGTNGKDGVNGKDGTNGKDGLNGADGLSLLTGNGGPSINLGKNGDSYIDLNSWDYYVKTNGIWVKSGNIKGKDADSESDEQGLDFYLLDNGTYGVGIGNALYLSEIHVPEYYKGKEVTKVVDYFGSHENRNVDLSFDRTFFIPKTVTSIGDYAFKRLFCNDLTLVIDCTSDQMFQMDLGKDIFSNVNDVHFILNDGNLNISDLCGINFSIDRDYVTGEYFTFGAELRMSYLGYYHYVYADDPLWTIEIEDPSVLSYDEITHQFHALDAGTTNVRFTYQNKSRVIEINVSDNSYTFEMWTGFGRDYTRPIDSMVQDFNYQEENVNIYNVMKGSSDNVLMQVLNSYSQGLIPDIVVAPSDHVAEYFNAGILVPLDSYIERYNDEHMCNILEDYYGECMYPNIIVGYDYDTEDPYITGLPFTQSTEVMLSNGLYFDYFKSLDDSIKVPETWDELKEVSPKILSIVESQGLQDNDKNFIVGKIDGTKHAYDFRIIENEDDIVNDEIFVQDISNLTYEKPFYSLGYDDAGNAFTTILHQWGIEYTSYSKDNFFNQNGYGRAHFWNDANKNNTKEALQYFVELNQESRGFAVPYTFGETSDCTAPFEQGRCLFNVTSSIGLFKYKFVDDELTQRAQRLETHPIPYKDAFQKAVISENLSLCLLNRIGLVHDFVDYADYQEKMYQAFCAIVKLTTGDLQAAWCVSTGAFPTSTSSVSSVIYQDYLNNENPTRLQKLYRDAGLVNSHEYNAEHSWEKFIDPGFRGSNFIHANVKAAFLQIFNSASIDDAMDLVWNSLPSMVKSGSLPFNGVSTG